jgi:hypothetical protein
MSATAALWRVTGPQRILALGSLLGAGFAPDAIHKSGAYLSDIDVPAASSTPEPGLRMHRR